MEHVDELHLDGDPVTEAFFSAPPPPVEIAAHDWDELEPLDRGHVRAMHATWIILGCSLLGLGGFLVHQKLIMPTPVELGATPPEIHWTVQEVPMVQAGFAPATAIPVSPAVVVPAPVPVPVPDILATAPAQRPRPTRAVVAPRAQTQTARPAARTAAAPGNAELDRSLQQAHAALRAGNARLARGHAINALALDPGRADAYIVLGAARSALADPGGAQQAYRLCAERAIGPRAAACKALVR
jgi:hypothetical protein